MPEKTPAPIIVGDLLFDPKVVTVGEEPTPWVTHDLMISRARSEAREAYLRELTLDAEAMTNGDSATRFDWSHDA